MARDKSGRTATVTDLSARRTPARSAASQVGAEVGVNVGCVVGTLSSMPEIRALASGSAIAILQITSRLTDGPTHTLPVVVVEPPAWVGELVTGDVVVACGPVRRRFFRSGASTASRVELEAAAVARWADARGRRRVGRVLAAHLECFEARC